MNILHIDCSPRSNSYSRKLSALVVHQLKSYASSNFITRRDLGRDPIPHVDELYTTAISAPQELQDGVLTHAVAQSEKLIQELESSDAVVIGTPVNNFTVPSVLKAWIDNVLRMGRTIGVNEQGEKVGLIQDKPVYFAIASGGFFYGEKAKQPDFMTPYLSAALGCIGIKSVEFIPVQGTAFLSKDEVMEQADKLVLSMHQLKAQA